MSVILTLTGEAIAAKKVVKVRIIMEFSVSFLISNSPDSIKLTFSLLELNSRPGRG